MQINYKPIGDFIKLVDKRNKDSTIALLPNLPKKNYWVAFTLFTVFKK